jgi:hypothetical protein
VGFEWDTKKAKSNLNKHKIDFADAATVFDDDLAITIPDEHPDEERFVTIGMDALARVLVVVYTWRDDETIRIISARKATPQEREEYEKGL